MRTDYADERIVVSSYNGAWFSAHYYAEVDGVEVHRVLTEGDAARLNRQRGSAIERAGDTSHAFDTVEDARAAAQAVVDDPSNRSFDDEWPRHLVSRTEGQWVSTSEDEWLDRAHRG